MSAPVMFLRLDGHARPGDVLRLQHTITQALGRGHRELVLDLAELTRLSAASMSLLCCALRRVRLPGHHARLQIVHAPPLVARILQDCEIDGLRLQAPEPPHPAPGPQPATGGQALSHG